MIIFVIRDGNPIITIVVLILLLFTLFILRKIVKVKYVRKNLIHEDYGLWIILTNIALGIIFGFILGIRVIPGISIFSQLFENEGAYLISLILFFILTLILFAKIIDCLLFVSGTIKFRKVWGDLSISPKEHKMSKNSL